jgi:hypothetical protein
MRLDLGIDNSASQISQRRQRAAFIPTHKARVSDHIRRDNRGQPTRVLRLFIHEQLP